MKMWIKIIILQVYWYLLVLKGPGLSPLLCLVSSLVLVALNYYLYRPQLGLKHYLLLGLGFMIWGLVQDGLLFQLGLFKANQFPWWLSSMWLVFVCYYDDVFNRFESWKWFTLAVMGGFGGVLAYWGGTRLADLEVDQARLMLFYGLIFISWASFFPLSLRLAQRK